MAKRMLIDAAHPEETRVVVTSGNRLEEFDFESSTKRQVKGNIYLAKVTRVEPSLQAAFVDYGGNRHGFLAFSEIHPDYYRIPVSDRRGEDGESEPDDRAANGDNGGEDVGVSLASALPEPVAVAAATDDDTPDDEPEAPVAEAPVTEVPVTEASVVAAEAEPGLDDIPDEVALSEPYTDGAAPPAEETAPTVAVASEADAPEPTTETGDLVVAPSDAAPSDTAPGLSPAAEPETPPSTLVSFGDEPAETPQNPPATAFRITEEAVLAVEISDLVEPEQPVFEHSGSEYPGSEHPGFEHPGSEYPDFEQAAAGQSEAEQAATEPAAEAGDNSDGFSITPETVETMGGDEAEDVEEADAERRRFHHSRHYKIQEVVKRRQIMLVQVAKEERGNKGAALTTYLSLAGRYCVLMPNTNRGGGVSRKITSIADRRRLKDIVEDLEIPEGMGVIVRTAGAERSKAEIKRDYEYLLRLWNEIRDLTLQSTAPALIYEEGNLIKRSIRDLYTRDLEEVLVEGEEGYKTAKAFMRTLMPSHAKRVQPYRDPQIGLFHRFQIESQIDAIHSPVAQLRSGGYTVINQTEALVAIDVNSGRSTRERNIEETALRTNLEAADEIARQLRLRDLAGLIVIDFIDMEEHRNQVAVERRLKEALKNDRARIQVGRISPFGLMEMSRQRLRPSLAETSTLPCPHCAGTGFIRSVESTALYVLRSIEEEGIRRRSAEICIYVPTNVALYMLNQKRESLNQIEARYGLTVMVAQDDALIPPAFRLERLRSFAAGELPPVRPIQAPTIIEEDDEDIDDDAAEFEAETVDADAPGEHRREQREPNGDNSETEEERGRRRRRRRRRRPDDVRDGRAAPAEADTDAAEAVEAADDAPREDAGEPGHEAEGEPQRRRRGRRGGRVRPRRGAAADSAAGAGDDVAASSVEAPEYAEPGVAWSPEPLAWEDEAATIEPAAASVVETVPIWDVTPTALAEHHQPAEIAAMPEPAAAETAPPAEPEPEPEPMTNEAVPDPVLAEAAPSSNFEHAPVAIEAPPEPMPSAEVEQGIPYVSATERVLEEAVAMADAPPVSHESVNHHEPGHHHEPPPARIDDDVQTVTEKPSNPRRGWWQRLIQP